MIFYKNLGKEKINYSLKIYKLHGLFKPVFIMKIKLKIFNYVVPALLLTACGSGEDEKVDYEVTTDSLSSDVKSEILMIRSSIPSPSDMTKEIAAAKINYNKGILNPTSKSGSYSTNFQKAVAMGVYGTDLGYAASYNQSQDVMEYFGAITKLAKDLNIESIFDEELIGKIKDNMGKGDTLNQLMNQAYDKAERNLRSNQRVSLAAIMAAGGWIEGIYITSSLIKDSPNDAKTKAIYDKTWNHVSSFKNVMDLLTEYKSNPDCAKMLDELKEFQPFVDKANSSGGGVLQQADVVAINEKITAIRNKII